jgi:hypothetical protein
MTTCSENRKVHSDLTGRVDAFQSEGIPRRRLCIATLQPHSKTHLLLLLMCTCSADRMAPQEEESRLFTGSKTWKLIVSAATTVDQFLNGNEKNESTNSTIWSFLFRLLRSPVTVLYYFYLWLPLFWCTLFLKYLELIIRVSARRSARVRTLMKHILAFTNSGLVSSLR